MIPIQVEGLDTVADLTDPIILARTREKLLAIIRSTDPAQFTAQVKVTGERLYERNTKRRARDLDTLAVTGVEIRDEDQALRDAGRAMKKADKLQRQLEQKEQQLQALRAAAATDPALAKKLKDLGIQP